MNEKLSDPPISEKWDYEAALKTALKEREEFLQTNPQLRGLQNEIDASLSSVDVFQERMQILGTMIGNKLEELHRECSKLAAICDDLDIYSDLPIFDIRQTLTKLMRGKTMKEIKAEEQRELRETIIESLIYSPLFDGLNAEELKIIANHMKLFELEKDGILFKEGVRGDSVCFVLDGTMDIIKESSPGESAVIASLSKGRSIGEMAIIDNFPRSATVKARTKTSFLTLTRKSFDTLLKQYPEIGIKILKGISRLLSLNLRKTSSRLADYMLPLT